jgi:predicted nucleic acid-binding Zn ribbon protein
MTIPIQSSVRTDADFGAHRDREQRRYHARRPKKIADVVAQLITARGYGRLQAMADIESAWQSAAGEALARFTRAGRLQRGVLEITVSNSTMIQELGFQKQQILASLQAKLPDAKIRGLRFRIGEID